MGLIKISPMFTSQRCSDCGYTDSQNRKTQAEFLCLACGFEANADFNAAMNIVLAGLEFLEEEARLAA